MGKNVLIVSTSPRKDGNSNMLADAFAKGAESSGNSVEIVRLYDKTINFCKGCLACQETGFCVIRDDASIIAQKMFNADVLVFATPIYYYEMSGQMKTMLDRANPLYDSDYKFKDIYLLTAAAETEEETSDGAINGLEGWISCFERASLKGVVKGHGFTDVGEIKDAPVLKEAYEMGASV
ncbi:MAG: flavodoxin family protein [Clostridiales bacterium]|nr:flavodoxin family protein [Clostridiales bacterium]